MILQFLENLRCSRIRFHTPPASAGTGLPVYINGHMPDLRGQSPFIAVTVAAAYDAASDTGPHSKEQDILKASAIAIQMLT